MPVVVIHRRAVDRNVYAIEFNVTGAVHKKACSLPPAIQCSSGLTADVRRFGRDDNFIVDGGRLICLKCLRNCAFDSCRMRSRLHRKTVIGLSEWLWRYRLYRFCMLPGLHCNRAIATYNRLRSSRSTVVAGRTGRGCWSISLPLVSSSEISLYPAAFGRVRLDAANHGLGRDNGNGGICSALYTRPVMIG